MWNHESEKADIIFENNDVVVFSDHSYDDWNGRVGFTAQSKETVFDENAKKQTSAIEFSGHYTGQGFMWGKWRQAGNPELNLIGIPAHHQGGTVEENLRAAGWHHFDHPFLDGARSDATFGFPMVPMAI